MNFGNWWWILVDSSSVSFCIASIVGAPRGLLAEPRVLQDDACSGLLEAAAAVGDVGWYFWVTWLING